MSSHAPAGRLFAAALSLGALGLQITACSSSSPSTNTSTTSLQSRNVVVAAVAATGAAGLYIAEEKGYFKAAGLNVTIKPIVSGANVIPDLVNGSVDVDLGQWTSDIGAEAHGVPLRALAEGNSGGTGLEELVTAPGSKIATPQELRGKNVAVNVTEGLSQMLSESVLEQFQVQPNQVHYVAIPFPEMGAALARGEVSAAFMIEPYLTQAEEMLGVTELADIDQGATQNVPITGYVAASSWVQKNPGTAAAFVRALQRGQQVAAASRLAVEQVLPLHTLITKRTASVIALGDYPIAMDAIQLQRVGFLMQKFGLLPESVNVKSLITEMTQ